MTIALHKPLMTERSAKTTVFVLIKGLDVGGAEKLLTLAVPHLNRTEFDYEVGYLVPSQNTLVKDLELAGIPVFCLGLRKPYDARAIARLAGLLRRRQVDVLHIHLPYPGVIGRMAAKLAGVRSVVYTEHSPVDRYHPITQRANRLTYRLNDAVIAVSNEVHASIARHYGIGDRPKVFTVVNGVDYDALRVTPAERQAERESVRQEFGLRPDQRVVINVANLRPEKGHRLLLKAARDVSRQDPDVAFLLVGRGEMEEEIKAEARTMGIMDKLVFTGFRTDVTRLLRGSDLFVLASDYEGLPISLLEAMAAGLPAVCVRVGGIPEVLDDGVTGLLSAPGDAPQLAENIRSILGDPDLQARMGAAAVERVARHYSIKSMVGRTEDIYRELRAAKQAHAQRR